MKQNELDAGLRGEAATVDLEFGGCEMIIWRGAGVLVFGIVFLCSLVANLLFDWAYGDGFYTSHSWACGISLLFAGGITWVAGKKVDERGGRTVIDKASGEEITLGKPHFFSFPSGGGAR